ncbi:MAG: winged helix-turn-helix domain-containing protein [Chloroflexi bacterium]|nr:winged helix-turn-helix domain-containing protein [Chloroflexota bacterium]OJW03426.1 MAG: hypothetical protein BGO39_10480 [Chloroflexi bacterium 54-19]
MPKQIVIKPFLSPGELEARYRQAKNPVDRSQWQIIWLLTQEKPVKTVAEVTGYSIGWIRELARRYNKYGEKGLGDKRQNLPGVQPLLSPELQTELTELLNQPPSGGGEWNGPKVAEWIENKTGRKVRRQRGWEYLKKTVFKPKRGRPHHVKPESPESPSGFQKSLF